MQFLFIAVFLIVQIGFSFFYKIKLKIIWIKSIQINKCNKIIFSMKILHASNFSNEEIDCPKAYHKFMKKVYSFDSDFTEFFWLKTFSFIQH